VKQEFYWKSNGIDRLEEMGTDVGKILILI
jgi:hypothetical protein